MKLIDLIRSALNRYKRSESLQALESQNLPLQPMPESQSKTLEIEKESLSLGMAAGYAGRALREIELSLNRMESQIVTKDWYIAQESVKMEMLKSILTKLDSMQYYLNNISSISSGLPQPIRAQINQHVEQIRAGVNDTMEALVNAVKEAKEISYVNLSNRLGLTESGLRGILSMIARKDSRIKRFKVKKHGWVRFMEPNAPTDNKLTAPASPTSDSGAQSATSNANQ